jgi:hypothetical protein
MRGSHSTRLRLAHGRPFEFDSTERVFLPGGASITDLSPIHPISLTHSRYSQSPVPKFGLESPHKRVCKWLAVSFSIHFADAFSAGGLVTEVIVASIVAILGFVAGHFWRDTLAPGIQNLTYRGTKINGRWTSELPGELVDDYPKRKIFNALTLDQNGHKVTGTMSKRIVSDGHEQKPEEFKVVAYIRDLYLVGHIEAGDGGRLAAMAFVCKVEGDASTMTGGQVFWDVTQNCIRATDRRTWKRIS